LACHACENSGDVKTTKAEQFARPLSIQIEINFLETEFNSQLNISRSTCTDDRICRRDVGSGKDRPERGRVARINQELRIWIGEVRMVEHVEKFAPQLEADTFGKPGCFDD
jgi:hypothetical protein